MKTGLSPHQSKSVKKANADLKSAGKSLPATTLSSAFFTDNLEQMVGASYPAPHSLKGNAPIQLKLPSGQEFLHYTYQEVGQREDLNLILSWLTAYNQEKAASIPDITQLFRRIDYLDKSINIWFDTWKGPDLSLVPNAAYMKRLHEEVAEEHRNLVDFARTKPTQVLPVNTDGMTIHQKREVYRIWNSIVAEKGNIVVTGNSSFQSKTYADLARLLQGEYGRALVGYLDGGDVKARNRTTIGSDFDSTFNKYNKNDKGEKGSYAFPRVNLKDEDDNSSELIPLPQIDLLYPVAATRDDINQAILQGAPGVTYKNVSYKFNTGTGSLVKIVKEEKEEPLIDRELNQILTPSYLTLGHELGHAFRSRGGASFRGEKSTTFDSLLDEEENGDHSANSQSLWTSSEEIVNITTSENQLRDEHLLSKRSYHGSQNVAFHAIFERELIAVMGNFSNDPAEKRLLTNMDYWQQDILPFLREQHWTKPKLLTARQHIQYLQQNIMPVALEKRAQWQQLFALQTTHNNIINLENFKKLKEVREVMANLMQGPWVKQYCSVRIAQVSKALSDKQWWRSVKIAGTVLAALSAVGVGYYLKYVRGVSSDNPQNFK